MRRRRFFRRSSSKSKLRNVRIKIDGYSFASKLEASVYGLLKLQAMAREIDIIQHQCKIYLSEAEIGYIPDFKCRDMRTGEVFFVEAKGFETADWKIKKKLWSKYGPAPLHVWSGTCYHPTLREIITPRPTRSSPGSETDRNPALDSDSKGRSRK
jgi:hypothetical protein